MTGGLRSPDPNAISSWSKEVLPETVEAAVPARGESAQLVLDDGSREVDIGFNGTAASQFLWFNQFEIVGSGIDLEEIQVLFPSDPAISAGDAIQIAVFFDDDGDPTNGAALLLSLDAVVGAADGTTFSSYPVEPPLRVVGQGELLIGVVNRFVVSGVSPPSRPAALDNSSSQGRSWVAVWTGDPPAMPALPSDSLLSTIDFVEPGNWMIRGAGSILTPAPTAIPSLGRSGLVGLAVLLGLVGALLLFRARIV